MKILHVNTHDITGGAARAAYRLHQALLAENLDSRMLVQYRKSDDHTISVVSSGRVGNALSLIRPALDSFPLFFYRNRSRTLYSPAWLPSNRLVEKINLMAPDIVHIHWISDGMARIEDLTRIIPPIAWSLHDMWAFTGGCHNNQGCEGYLDKCKTCKVLGSGGRCILSQWAWKRKDRTYARIPNLNIIGLSNWMRKRASASKLLSNARIHCLPNPIDTSIYKPFDKDAARKLWNLPRNKKLVLYGANAAIKDPNKGYALLCKALNKMRHEVELIIFGSSKPRNANNLFPKSYYLGYLHDDISLATIYNAADVVVVPSLQENLSNVILESTACGMPVVAFDVGGNGDMIEHKKNGYLAKPLDIDDLAEGIKWVLCSKDYRHIRSAAREKALRRFDSRAVAKKYISLYEKILTGIG